MSLFEATNGLNNEVEGTKGTADETVVSIEYYTDPLCSWSWAFEAQWRHLRYACSGSLKWHYRMGGLLTNWHGYHDPFNDVANPAQMGPQWLQVQEITGMPLDDRIWRVDPPASSYPACMAVKAAELQGQELAEKYLRRLREAVMLERRNIAREEVLLALAEEISRTSKTENSFDFNRFRNDLSSSETQEAFRQDLRDAAYYGIGRFPTLILKRADGRGIVLVGYRPYDVLWAALQHLIPDIRQKPEMPREQLAIAYVKHWQRVIGQELVEVLGGTTNETVTLLESLISRGMLALADDSQSETPIYVPSSDASTT